MSEISILIILYAVGVVILTAEIFIPSHGILTVAGVGFLAAAVVRTFQHGGREAGLIALFACLMFLPVFAFVAIRYWHRTPMGRLISPPNPVLTAQDAGLPVEELQRYVGHCGRSKTPLRPVGICEFNGRRVSCVAEMGMIDAGIEVEARGVSHGNLLVAARSGTV